jgi:hypothetical protein
MVSTVKTATAVIISMCLFASPAGASGVHSLILPWLDLPADTMALCSNGAIPAASSTLDGCWDPPALERWVIQKPYPDAVAWVRGQIAEVGWEEHPTYRDNHPQTYWTHNEFGVDVAPRSSFSSDLMVNSLGE